MTMVVTVGLGVLFGSEHAEQSRASLRGVCSQEESTRSEVRGQRSLTSPHLVGPPSLSRLPTTPSAPSMGWKRCCGPSAWSSPSPSRKDRSQVSAPQVRHGPAPRSSLINARLPSRGGADAVWPDRLSSHHRQPGRHCDGQLLAQRARSAPDGDQVRREPHSRYAPASGC